ncbi:MAG: hypothetical protein JXR46_02945 [Calditrichaceae bacterium]|nr:hypothetical protein [Calditrichaceae bacterium]MBN2707981.1 hypothetical protein [Calditrichaceae bacterium]RQV95919.1 MAG: DNA photolyase [Calditrichota bacterium]
MRKEKNYQEKFADIKVQSFFTLMDKDDRDFVEKLAPQFRLTFQEVRQLAEACRDVRMWREQPLPDWWRMDIAHKKSIPANKNSFLSAFRQHLNQLKSALKSYKNMPKPVFHQKAKILSTNTDRIVFGECPVQSPKTVCCNLKTLDAVEGCIFGCSYCTIQTFYNEQIRVEANLEDKLKKIILDPKKIYHIGTGQSSDSLAFGNRNGILDALCAFAASHSANVLLEFKTKSDNVHYILENDIPKNVVCSWSLNPQIIIDYEEHFTASLDNRIKAARSVADKGVKVSFHFHPIIYYDTWYEDYTSIARRIMDEFDPREILFISFGSLTFIKPALQKIRQLGFPTKIHQMEFVKDPHGKLTYPDDIKIRKFSAMYTTFQPWHDRVFFYLCMEKSSIWENSLGYVYPDNSLLEKALFDSAQKKIREDSGR